MEGPTHGKDGWRLEDYSWDPNTGVARFEYEREIEKENEEIVTDKQIVFRNQPAEPKHVGW